MHQVWESFAFPSHLLTAIVAHVLHLIGPTAGKDTRAGNGGNRVFGEHVIIV